ncbi:MAG TPA: hypothetical protein VGA99_05295 [bacterium]
MVIDEEHPGQLKVSTQPYDTRVAGVISGANGINPAIALHQEGLIEGGENVALSGRVYVWADANPASIKPGDLLTTSSTPGHAMKATERELSHGDESKIRQIGPIAGGESFLEFSPARACAK